MKTILHNLRHLFKAFQRSDDQIPKLYNTNDKLNVTELLTTIKTSTKQTKSTSKIIDLRGRLKTADHYGALCQTGGKPSTWFPPGGLVEQDISPLTKSTYQINFSKKIHLLYSPKMESINTFHKLQFPNDLDLLQTPNTMQMTRITI